MVKLSMGVLIICLGWASSAMALPLPPPDVALAETETVVSNARLYQNPSYGGSPHTTTDTITRFSIGGDEGFLVAYYDQNNKVCLARNLNDQGWETITFTSTVSGENNHRTPNVGVSSDGRIHYAFDHHNTTLRYLMSDAGAAQSSSPFSTSMFPNGEQSFLKSGETLTSVTYPSFVRQESTGKLHMFWRQTVPLQNYGDTYMAEYLGSGLWSSKRIVVDGNNGGTYEGSHDRRPYHSDFVSSGDNIHMTWVWRESPYDVINAHDLMYAVSANSGATWKNRGGTTVGNSTTTINLASPVTEFSLDYDWKTSAFVSSAVDSQGRTHVVMRQLDSPNRYWHFVVGLTGRAPQMLPFDCSDLATIHIDKQCDTVYVVGRYNNKFHVYAAQLLAEDAPQGAQAWDTWTQVHTGTVTYRNYPVGRISDDGKTLWILGQRHSATNGYSALELLTYSLDPNFE